MDIVAEERARQEGEGGVFSTLTNLFGPNEAEAFPIGKVFKVGSKTLGSLSSASERLAGKELQGKVIKEVRKGHGNWRDIIFNDGTALPVTKDYVHNLAQSKGTETYLDLFEGKDVPDRLHQAMKSMRIHESMVYPDKTTRVGRAVTQNLYNARQQRLQELQSTPLDSVMVQRGTRSYMMPKEYAELLEKNGILKVVKSRFDHFDHSQSVSPETKMLDAIFKNWDKGGK